MKANLKLLGHDLSIAPQTGNTGALNSGPMQGPIDKLIVSKGIEILKKYKAAKEAYEARIVDNEKWYKLRHWEIIRQKESNQDPEPTTAWLFNSLANKHADAMDNYPEPNILPREPSDQQEASSLSDVVPMVIEKNKYETTYSNAWWYKLKNGTVAYGEFWDTALENGLGDISIKKLDLLNIFWEPGKQELQDSRNLFIVDTVDDDLLAEAYPWLVGKLQNKIIEVKKYVFDDTVDTTDKSLVVDWYYKKKTKGKQQLHLVKFVGESLIWASENDPAFADIGIYEHGMYPVFFDVLFPEEGTPVGFGYVDVIKNPQMYVDKLDQIIIRNALQVGKKRWFIKDNGGINEPEYADWSKDFVHVSGNLNDDNIKEIQMQALDPFIVQHRQQKIDELKETSGTNDFNRDEAGGGVTAASAIAALQEAGNKLARDMIKGSFRVYSDIVNMCIELIAQFYDEERHFRIEGPDGQFQFINYSNKNLKMQPIPPTYAGEGMIQDPMTGQPMPDPNYVPKFRKPVFDIKVKAQKSNPFSKAAQNELAKELYGSGFFDPMRADQALIALDLMEFEGKDKVIAKVSQNQMLVQQIQMMQQQMDKMALIIQQLTGRDMFSEEGQGQPGQQQKRPQAGARVQQPQQRQPIAPMTQQLAGRASANANSGGNVRG